MIRLFRNRSRRFEYPNRQRVPEFMKKIYIVMIIGIIHGLIYVFIIPPWQHYDEPGHFEYAWLTANRLRLPQVGDYDVNMRLAVGQSLIKSNFFGDGILPNLTDPSKPIWIGIPQLIDPPLYYVIEAVPFFILKGAPVNVQLYAGRIVSLLFLLLTIFSAYKLTQELSPADHPLQWMVPVFIAMLPSFVEFMSSLNNFAAAIGIFSLWLFVSVKLIKEFSIKYIVYLLLLTIAGVLTQNILYPLLLYLPFALLLSILPRKVRFIAWIVTGVSAIAVLLIVFSWGDAAYWIRANYQDISSRVHLQGSANSAYALAGMTDSDTAWSLKYPSWNSGFFQLVPAELSDQLRGKTVTIGAWVWSDQDMIGYGPGLNSLLQFQDSWLGFKQEALTKNPRFIASVVEIPDTQDRLQIWVRTTSPGNSSAVVYYSGVILVEGVWPIGTAPIFNDPNGTTGTWGNKTFTNLARNAQFQQSWPYLRPQISRLIFSKIQGMKPFHISSFLSVFLDPPGTTWYTKTAGNFIFDTFWAKFGWGQVPLINNGSWFRPYLFLFIFTLLGIAGSLLTGFRLVKSYKHEYAFLAAVAFLTIVVAILYGVYTMGGALRYRPYIPTARYIFPAIVAISLFLVAGWHGLLAWLSKIFKFPTRLSSFFFSGFLLAVDLYSILSVIIFFVNR